MARLRLLLPAVLAAVLAAACGEAQAPAPAPAADPTPGAPAWGVHPRAPHVPVDLPVAVNARWDRASAPAFEVGLTAGGALWVGGRIGNVGPAPGAESTATQRALAALRADRPDAGGPPPVRLHVDRETRWTTVVAALRLLRATPGGIDRLQWSVRSPVTFRGVHQGGRTTPAGQEDAAAPAVEIHVRPPRDGRGGGTTLELLAGGESVVVEEEGPDPDGPDATRAAWGAFLSAWRARVGMPGTVRLCTVDGIQGDAHRTVRWRHVVTVLDLLLGEGVRTVHLPSLGVRLDLDEPEDLGRDPFQVPDDPVATPVVVFLATCMVLGAFALTFVPLWFERSARKRPGRSSRS